MSVVVTRSDQARTRLPLSQLPQRLHLSEVSWDQYSAIGRVLADRPDLRITYDHGNLEIMVTSPQHEIYKKWLVRLVEVLLEMFGTPFATAGKYDVPARGLDAGL